MPDDGKLGRHVGGGLLSLKGARSFCGERWLPTLADRCYAECRLGIKNQTLAHANPGLQLLLVFEKETTNVLVMLGEHSVGILVQSSRNGQGHWASFQKQQ